MKKKSTLHRNGWTLIEVAIVCLIFLVLVFFATIQPRMESKTYNKLTGADTTWWDALWVELRVQASPDTRP